MSPPEFNSGSLTELHDSVNESLLSPTTKLEIIHRGQAKWAHDVSEASLKMADSCAAAKDLLLLAKDHLHHLQFAFRRISAATTAADLAGNHNFAPHRLPRKQLKKAILKRIHSLKAGMKNGSSAAPAPPRTAAPAAADSRQTLRAVVDLLKEVRANTLSIVRSLLTLIAIPNPDGKTGPGRKDPIFGIRFTRVDSLSFWERCDVVCDRRGVMKRLEEVERVVGDMEGELEEMFRRLIRTRASLLNILTT